MQGTTLQSFNKFGFVVQEKKLFKEIVDAQTRTMDDGQWAITKAHLEDTVLR
jgi:hypothetical protein